MMEENQSAHAKALRVNLDKNCYGTFAEIGAGQEVARWFFRVGGASGTVAKTISAYDMTVSDAIYGACERYVSRQRLQTMLDHEFALLQERLGPTKGKTTRFFVFADTVAASSYTYNHEPHGWMGIRFQRQPGSEPNDVILHFRMLDRDNVQQQEALGIMGVNLLHGSQYLADQPEAFLKSLLDELSRDRVELDMVKFSGPDFMFVDNRLMSLWLVKNGLAQAAMFTPQGDVIQPAEFIYKKPILIERGSFRPLTNVATAMLEAARSRFLAESPMLAEELVVLMEITMKNLLTEGGLDARDFLARVDCVGAVGKSVLISNYGEYYRLAAYLSRYTKNRIGLVMGIPSLREVFDDKYYRDLEGGILESLGQLFKNTLRVYAYPLKERGSAELVSATNLQVAPHLRHLYAYLLETGFIQDLYTVDGCYQPYSTRQVLGRITAGDPAWESMVPAPVAQIIRERGLFGASAPILRLP
jgi:hypothetical protein